MRTFRLMIRPLAVVMALWISCCVIPSPAAENNSFYSAALDSISSEELRQHVEYLAADALEGREAGTLGGQKAGDYLGAQLEELGIRGAGVDGGFCQPFARNFRNIIGRVEGSDTQWKNQVVIVCAHYDHVGYGTKQNSRGPIGEIHNGADDNASGVSAVLELAQALARLPMPLKRSVLVAFWDAEEEEMLGSKHWLAHPTIPLDRVVAIVNLDMVGRLRDRRLTVYGSRSGYGFRRLLSQENQAIGLRLDFSWELEDDGDHYGFFQHGIPILFLHTGLHDEYHSPRDDAGLINSEGTEQIVRLLFGVVRELSERPLIPGFRPAAGRESEKLRKQLADYAPKLPDRLGAAWTQRADSAAGLHVSRIASRSPAARADIRPGDRIVRFANHEVRSSDQLDSTVLLTHGTVPVVVQRPGQQEPLSLTVQLEGEPMQLGITWRTDEAEPGSVILTFVVPGSPAANAGLSVGDRIYEVAGQGFADEEGFRALVQTRSDLLRLLVERDGRLRIVNLDFHTGP